jgi:microcystin-dependent protein
MIPGEVRMWSGTVLPVAGTYGTWVWADGSFYNVSDHPLAAGNIGAQWKTFDGSTDPGAGKFRVPDLRGLVAAGLDQMPGGARANRMTRTVAITLATKTGEETHKIVVAEMAGHGHSISSVGDHQHTDNFQVATLGQAGSSGAQGNVVIGLTNPGAMTGAAGGHGHSAGNTGGNTAHENVQPTVFVPYIVYLDG